MKEILKEENRKIQLIIPDTEELRRNLSSNGRVVYGNGKITSNQVPTDSGIYLIGEANYEEDNQRLVFKVKVGQGKNLYKRLSTYITYTTSVKLFDTLNVYEPMLNNQEEKYQSILDRYGWKIGNTEWYVISEQNYQILKKMGFSGFNKLKT